MMRQCATPSARDVCVFLADYGAALFASGATCIRLDKNVSRIAGAFGLTAEMTMLPRHIHLTVTDVASDEILTSIASVPESGINFTVNTELSRLSWEIADGKLDFRQAIRRYECIRKGTSQNKWLLLFLVSLANASFCRLFGGDIMAMGIVGVATFAGFYLKILLTRCKIDARVIFIICSFVSSVIGATDMLFSLGSTPEVAIATSVLYLVPGIPFLNSFSDMLYRRYLCAFARFSDAMILTCCLSIGICLGMFLMNASMF